MPRYRLGLTSDILNADGTMAFPDYALGDLLAAPAIDVVRIDAVDEIAPHLIRDIDLLITVPHGAHITARSVGGSGDRLAGIVRVGVGYEDVDVAALTRASIALAIPSEATQRPTAVAALTLILALANRLLEKDRLSRSGPGSWALRPDLRGRSLEGQLLGLVGCGHIGRELIRISRPLGMRFAVSDPAFRPADASELGAELMPLDELMTQADIVSLHCPLNGSTRHLIDRHRIGLMHRSAILINTARGGIVDQEALIDALTDGRIAGAGLDVFDPEPLPAQSALAKLENVVLGAHALNWTRELDRDLGRANQAAIEAMLRGVPPPGLVNLELHDDVRWLGKLARLAAQGG